VSRPLIDVLDLDAPDHAPVTAKRGPGRPPKSAADKRRPRVSLRLSDAEWTEVQAKAGRRPVSVWLRDLALGA